MIKIYTKYGDGGATMTRKGQVPKSGKLIGLLGSVDQLNATFGWCGVLAENYTTQLRRVQNQLFDIGAWLATIEHPSQLDDELQSIPIVAEDITLLEHEIDATTPPPLRNFVLPGGTEFVSRLHLARCAVRTTEHALWQYIDQSTTVHVFLNRLSDWCFALARDSLHRSGLTDITWTQP